jgi:uncharacterized protein YciI
MLFSLIYTPGPNWIAGKPVMEQPLQAHIAYMLELNARKTLVIGGPLMDDAGGLIIVEVESQEEAQTLMQDDPAIRSGIVEGQAHPWYPLINRYTNENHLISAEN